MRRGSWIVTATIGIPLLVLGALPGCGSNESGSSGTGGGAATSTSSANTGSGAGGGGSFGETPCVQCIGGICATEAAACDAVAECKAYFDCVFACPAKNTHEADEACTDQCTEPASSPEADAFFACFKKQNEDDAGQCDGPCD